MDQPRDSSNPTNASIKHACITCINSRIHCDGGTPQCENCRKLQVDCKAPKVIPRANLPKDFGDRLKEYSKNKEQALYEKAESSNTDKTGKRTG